MNVFFVILLIALVWGDPRGRAPLELLATAEAGEMPCVGSIPREGLEPGQYGLRAVVRQGASQSEQGTRFAAIP